MQSQFVPAVMVSASNSSHVDKFIDRHVKRFNLELDKDATLRELRLSILEMFMNGTIYDNLSAFNSEYLNGGGNYIPLKNRRPSVLYNLCKIIVNESVGMLFGEGHFPEARCSEDHEKTNDFICYLNKVSKIKQVMLNAAQTGSIGSVCIIVKVLNRKFYFDVLNTKHLFPIFDQNEPDKLSELHDKKKIDGSTLMSYGYDIPEKDKNKYFYVKRTWTTEREIYYKPYLVDDVNAIPQEDASKSTDHNLGFVPAVWIQNTPKAHHIDGECTFAAAIDISVEIDYQLSQVGRGLYYNSDPILAVKDPSTVSETQFIKNQHAMKLDEKGDAFYVEITGNSVDAVLNYVKTLREYGLEAVRGNRSSPEKAHTAQSGRALQMMNHPLITLVDEMRLTYGEYGLVSLYKMCIAIFESGEFDLDLEGNEPDAGCDSHIALYWQDWYPQTGRDKLEEAQALGLLRQNKIISQKSAIEYLASEYGIDNSDEEIKAIDKEVLSEDNSQGEYNSVDQKDKSSGS